MRRVQVTHDLDASHLCLVFYNLLVHPFNNLLLVKMEEIDVLDCTKSQKLT